MPQLYTMSLEAQKPAKSGNYFTDADTDRCLHNLWQVSSQMQRSKTYNNDPVCPLSNAPYKFSSEDDVLTARCPNPRMHGFSAIMVSNQTPMPKLVK